MKDQAQTKESYLTKLENAMNLVDEDTKHLVISKYLNRKSISELEVELGLSKSAVKMRLKSTRNKLINIVNDESIRGIHIPFLCIKIIFLPATDS